MDHVSSCTYKVESTNSADIYRHLGRLLRDIVRNILPKKQARARSHPLPSHSVVWPQRTRHHTSYTYTPIPRKPAGSLKTSGPTCATWTAAGTSRATCTSPSATDSHTTRSSQLIRVSRGYTNTTRQQSSFFPQTPPKRKDHNSL